MSLSTGIALVLSIKIFLLTEFSIRWLGKTGFHYKESGLKAVRKVLYPLLFAAVVLLSVRQ